MYSLILAFYAAERRGIYPERLNSPELNFPITLQPTDPQTQQQWMEEHDQMTLEDWLRELTSGMA